MYYVDNMNVRTNVKGISKNGNIVLLKAKDKQLIENTKMINYTPVR